MCESVLAAVRADCASPGLGGQESIIAHGATGSAAHPPMWM